MPSRPVTPDDIELVVKNLEGEIGFKEELGQNAGKCSKYQLTVGGEEAVLRHDSWCADFGIWGWIISGLRSVWPLIISGSCQEVRVDAEQKGFILPESEPPQRGDICLVVSKVATPHMPADHAHHWATVTGSPDDSGVFPTVEGNSNTDGSSNGTSVVDRHRGGAEDHNKYVFMRLLKACS